MNKLKNKQHGIGFLGWSSILGIFAFFVLVILRIFPLYNEKFEIMRVMESVVKRPDSKDLSTKALRKIFQKNIDIQTGSRRFNTKSIKDIVKVVKDKKTKKKYLHVVYEGRNEFFKDIKFLLEFDQKMELGRSISE